MSEVNNTTLVDFDAKVKAIDACLPQTQCTRCSFPDCISYAKAIANNEADINQCPPGGDVTIAKLATLLEAEVKPLNEAVHGEHKPRFEAKIIEDLCIGCTMCIKACPVDAIIGGHKSMHVIIADECTGCELCIPPCPMDCITMEMPEVALNAELESSDIAANNSPWKDFGYTDTQTQYAKKRHLQRDIRLDKTSISKSQQINARKLSDQDIGDTIMDILKRKL